MMKARLVEMEETIKKLTEETGTLCQENVALRQTNEHVDSGRDPASVAVDEERHKMHLELQELGDKYAEIIIWVGAPPTVDQLLVSTDLPYSIGVMVVPLLPKFKLPQMELEHLNTFKAHLTLHSFPGGVA